MKIHDTHVSRGAPYDHRAKITCPDCIAMVHRYREGLCNKYGWSEWPDDLKGSLEGE